MIDREVRQLEPLPETGDAEGRLLFSEYAEVPNIVLLGDPGAGKTHLFRSACEAVGGVYVTARDFLNRPKVGDGTILFVDALDERRAGRGDHDTINAVVKKLFESNASKVRISCRVADWLGATDLTAFNAYFNDTGGATVLRLAALSIDEQLAVLRLQGVPDPEKFREEAIARGMLEFLGNPQNLILLVTAVKGGQWPASRKELFDIAVPLLLRETNNTRSRSGQGQFTPEELFEVAGAVCAVRLISDVAGINLAENSADPNFPPYRSLSFVEPEKAAAALSRRAFEALDVERVDYTHRTVAEYMAASWLARMVRGGLPLGRVRALIGIDGHPAAELRGLNAWLAVQLPEHVTELIDGDPYGVLTYGDAGALTPSGCKHLLNDLASLSIKDPWFRSADREGPAVGALARPDMVEAFQEILQSPRSGFAIRSVVVAALAAGAPLPQMQEDLIEVVWRTESSYAERSNAVDALVKMGPHARSALRQSYRQCELFDGDSLRLRAEMLATLYGDGFKFADVIDLASKVLVCKDELPGGSLWFLVQAVPVSDVPALLDAYPSRAAMAGGSDSGQRNLWEVTSFYERLLLRALKEVKGGLEPSRVYAWLDIRRSFRDISVTRREEFVTELRLKPALMSGLVDIFLKKWPGAQKWSFQHDFWDATFHAIPSDVFLERIIAHLRIAPQRSIEELALYELGLASCDLAPRAFDTLYALADERPHLAETRAKFTQCQVPDDHYKYRKKSAALAAAEGRVLAKNVERFSEDQVLIRSGQHSGALAWASKIYFGLDDPREALKPVERLIATIGEENAAAAIDGFMSALRRTDFPTLLEVADLEAQNRWFPWWLAIIAGLDECWKRTPSVDNYSDELLRVAMALELCHPTNNYKEDSAGLRNHGWKDTILAECPQIARDAYVAIVQAKFAAASRYITGLYELLHSGALIPFRRDAILLLLNDFSDAEVAHLEDMLTVAAHLPNAKEEVLNIARGALRNARLNEQQRDAWLAFAYVAAPDEFEKEVEARVNASVGMIWQLRDLRKGERIGDGSRHLDLRTEQLELIAHAAGRHFRNVFYPSRGWSGDTNEWDGAELVRNLINEISARSSEAATISLNRLAVAKQMETYHDHILHALENQRSRRREAEYEQPDWRQTIATLSNGRPASVPDLHALLVAQLRDIAAFVTGGNTDIYKRFWNEDSRGKVTKPKPEESCRDVLVDLLRERFRGLEVIVEPEGHMARNKRADISVALPGKKILIELKRDYNADVWSAIERQLENYTRDPEAGGHGVYGVFWFGEDRPQVMVLSPNGVRPTSATELEAMLSADVPEERRNRTAVIVLDVSGACALGSG